MARVPNRKITTPKGVAVWPHLHAPDTKFDKAGTYSTKITLEAADAAPVIAAIDEELDKSYEASKAKAKGKKIKKATPSYDENEDGSFTFNFKMKASGVREDGSKWSRRPAVFDAIGEPVPEGVRVGGGSTIRVAAELSPYYNAADKAAGVSLRLVAVQVIELVQFGERSAGEFGFDSVEGGFSADSVEAPKAAPNPFDGDEAADKDEDLAEEPGEDDDF